MLGEQGGDMRTRRGLAFRQSRRPSTYARVAVVVLVIAAAFWMPAPERAGAVGITVPCAGAGGGPLGLIAAIDSANATPATADTITLSAGCTYTFTSSNQIGASDATRFNWYGPNALPAIG